MVRNFGQVIRFLIVGLIAVGVDFVVYFGLLFILPGIHTSISKAVSYICGMIVSFIGHRVFVFQASDRHAKKQILPFVILYGSSLVANNIMNIFILNLVGKKVVAWFIAICTSTTINYIGMKFGVFKKSVFTS